MKIKIRNLGVLKYADFELGDFTILCGGNNTGKTYATYALFGFLYSWREYLKVEVSPDKLDQLFTEGAVSIDVREYAVQAERILSEGCLAYSGRLHEVFAAHVERFKEADFKVDFGVSDIPFDVGVNGTVTAFDGSEIFSFIKHWDSANLIVSFLAEKEKIRTPKEVIIRTIADALKDILFERYFPRPFISNAERTGVSIFRRGLNLARSKLLDESVHLIPLGSVSENKRMAYAMPVKVGLEYMENLELISRNYSFIADQYSKILADFADIIGGNYAITSSDDLYYTPKYTHLSLTMNESSSSVRSLLDIGFYLKHIARPGHLLIVDEPELNLHPENQRRVARLLARLVNLGIKVFITTHSDYIVKELNTLIMLNHDKPHLRRIAEQEGYKPEELISADKIKVYIAEEAPVKPDDGGPEIRCQTLTPADIDPFMGIEARSFDTTIATMNRIQEAIVWGEE